MVSSYNRKSNSSASNKKKRATGGRAYSQKGYSSSRGASQARRNTSGRQPQSHQGRGYSSVRVGDLDQKNRAKRANKKYRNYVIRIIVIVVLVVALIVGGVVVYNSSLFTVTNVKVTGVEHLTATEMTELAAVPEGTTLLRSNAGAIEERLKQNAWVKDVEVRPVFPDTLELVVTEREVAAVVQVPTDNAQTVKNWAIDAEGIWLMLIPDKDSKQAAAVNSQIYEDIENVLSITDVPYGTSPHVGSYCTDAAVTNALNIVNGMTTELVDQVKIVSATGAETATLTLDNGIEIAFGTAEDIREKERVCLQLIEENPGKIAYINVRVVDRPTWRAI